MTTATKTFTIQLPVAVDDLGRWLEANSATLSIQCMMGEYHVAVSKKRLLSYSDALGEHSQHWSLTRYGRDLLQTLEAALRAAGAIT